MPRRRSKSNKQKSTDKHSQTQETTSQSNETNPRDQATLVEIKSKDGNTPTSEEIIIGEEDKPTIMKDRCLDDVTDTASDESDSGDYLINSADEEVDDDFDFSDSDMEICSETSQGNEEEKVCDCCGKKIRRDTWKKCIVCYRVVYCNNHCLTSGKEKHRSECDKTSFFRSVEDIYQEDLGLEKYLGRDVDTLDKVPSLGQASLGGSKTTVLLRLGHKHKDITKAIYAHDAFGQEALIKFCAKIKSYRCRLYGSAHNVIEKNLQDLLKRQSFLAIFGACWTQLSETKKVIMVDSPSDIMFYCIKFKEDA